MQGRRQGRSSMAARLGRPCWSFATAAAISRGAVGVLAPARRCATRGGAAASVRETVREDGEVFFF